MKKIRIILTTTLVVFMFTCVYGIAAEEEVAASIDATIEEVEPVPTLLEPEQTPEAIIPLEPEETTPPAPDPEPEPEPTAPAPAHVTPAPTEADTIQPEGSPGATDDEVIEGEEELPDEESSTIEYPCVALEWKLSPDREHLYSGDEITLAAEIEPADSLRLQWQVAVKPTDELQEGEEEWVNIDSVTEKNFSFDVESRMQDWRWRLRVILENGEEIYSDEMMLPETVRTHEDEDAIDGEEGLKEEGPQDEEASIITDITDRSDLLPFANIKLSVDVPAEEITYGTEITLTAEILDACDEMMLQWQYLPAKEEEQIDDGAKWVDVPNANSATFSFELSEENEHWLWRLLIMVPEEEALQEANPEAVDVLIQEEQETIPENSMEPVYEETTAENELNIEESDATNNVETIGIDPITDSTVVEQ